MKKQVVINMNEIKEEIALALDNLKTAYTPYSHHDVSAVLVSKSGKKYTGINIENAAFSPTICAERTAFAKAISEGEKEFYRIVIIGGLNGEVDDYCPPCGVCRQVMMEFCEPESFDIVLAKNIYDYKIFKLKDVLPMGFGPANLRCEG